MNYSKLLVRPAIKLNNMIWGFSKGINTRVKNLAMVCSLLMLSFLGVLRYISWDLKVLFKYNTLASTLVAALLLIIVVICSVDRKIEINEVIIHPMFWTGWIMCFSMIILTSFFNDVYIEYTLWAIISLFLFLPFSLAWSLRFDYEMICVKMSQCVLIAADTFFALNLLIVPVLPPEQTKSYCGLVSNPNSNATIAIGACAAAVYLLLSRKQGSFVYIITISFSIALAVASNCRTALLAIFLEIIAGYIYFFKNSKRGKTRRALLILFGIVAAMVIIMAIIITAALNHIRMLDMGAYALEDIAAIQKSSGEDGAVFTFFDNMLTGRLRIWRMFISESTFWGNGSPSEPLMNVEATRYAHNHAVEILYTSGVLAMTGFVIFMLSGISFVIRCMTAKTGYRREHVLVIMVFTGYLVHAMLEVMTYPTSSITSLMMYMCIMPIAMRRKRRSYRDN